MASHSSSLTDPRQDETLDSAHEDVVDNDGGPSAEDNGNKGRQSRNNDGSKMPLDSATTGQKAILSKHLEKTASGQLPEQTNGEEESIQPGSAPDLGSGLEQRTLGSTQQPQLAHLDDIPIQAGSTPNQQSGSGQGPPESPSVTPLTQFEDNLKTVQNSKKCILDLPTQLVLNIASFLVERDDLENFAKIDDWASHCALKFLWAPLSLDISHLPDSLVPMSRAVRLPVGTPAHYIKRLRLGSEDVPDWTNAVWNLNSLLEVCTQVDYLELAMPLFYLALETNDPKFRSLKYQSLNLYYYNANIERKHSKASDDTLGRALRSPYLRNLTLDHPCGIGPALQRLNLQPKKLMITSLTIVSCKIMNMRGVSTLIRACTTLETLHIKHCGPSKPNNRFDGEEHRSAMNRLQTACNTHKESLRTLTITELPSTTRRHEYSTDIGGAMVGVNLTGLSSLSHLSLTLHDLTRWHVFNHLPITLQTLQVQAFAIPNFSRNINAYHQLDADRGEFMEMIDMISVTKQERFPCLQRLIWWFHGAKLPDEAPVDRVERLVFKTQKDKLADVGIELIWTNAKTLDETPFDFRDPDPKWKDGGKCTSSRLRKLPDILKVSKA